MKLYPDGSGYMKIDYWMKIMSNERKMVIDDIGIFNPDSIKSQFNSPYTTLENVVVYSDTTDSTTHAVIDFSFTHIDSLNKTKAFSDSKFSFVKNASGQIIFSQFISPIATGFGIDASSFNVNYVYNFSGDIVTHNAHKSSGRKLSWEYKLSEIGGGKTISVTFRPFKLKETPLWIYYLSGAVLLLVLIFLFKKKKS
ncbi:MAG: hypothetical protein KJN64_00855 [Ignavibacteria bacterium]|nr:hypothetical protein [Ignavibacteria bacterium]MBT8380797.1 hypothetical protein [Ignavibacteria bacterium]MBT8392748.1 hypothetical protein [Ignavibacteria bacterium]NNJ54309.1 hypothetical protein [Ignavibacteriaceae bacterium]NNL22057.1 hypothetical protein [Ignavibacteriaceae bacterium]